jgi:hypothetical protein
MTSRPVSRPPPPPDQAADDPLEERADSVESPAPSQNQSPRHDYEVRSSFDRLLPELIRRGLEAGRGPLEKVSESIFPKDFAAQLVGQLGDARSGIVKAVAQEVGRFLREADIAAELRKVLIGLDIEAQVRLRFKAREDGSIKPQLDVELGASDEAQRNAPNARRKAPER